MGTSKRRLIRGCGIASAGFGLAALTLAAAAPAWAAPTTVSVGALDTGYYCNPVLTPIQDPSGRCLKTHTTTNPSYQTGYIDITSGAVDIDLVFRGFFVFNLNNTEIQNALAAGDQLLAATLTTRNGVIACGAMVTVGDTCSPPQLVNLYGVQGSIDDLIAGTSSFNNLGQGDVFAGASFPKVTTQSTVSSYTLNSIGLQAVSAVLGSNLESRLALSVRNQDEVGEATESPLYVYGNTTKSGVSLQLQFGPSGGTAVPYPLPLLGAAAAYRVSRRLRRRSRGGGNASEADAGIEQGHQ